MVILKKRMAHVSIWLYHGFAFNELVSFLLQFAAPSKESGGPECPEGRQLERWLLLNPNKQKLKRCTGYRCREPTWLQTLPSGGSESWAVTRERETVNISEKALLFGEGQSRDWGQCGSSWAGSLPYYLLKHRRANYETTWQYSELLNVNRFFFDMCFLFLSLWIVKDKFMQQKHKFSPFETLEKIAQAFVHAFNDFIWLILLLLLLLWFLSDCGVRYEVEPDIGLLSHPVPVKEKAV